MTKFKTNVYDDPKEGSWKVYTTETNSGLCCWSYALKYRNYPGYYQMEQDSIRAAVKRNVRMIEESLEDNKCTTS